MSTRRCWLRPCGALLAGLLGLSGNVVGENAPGTTGLLEAAVGGKRTLVIADGPRIQDSHSMFFDALEVKRSWLELVSSFV